MVNYSVGLRNAAMGNTGFRGALTGGELRLYGGAIPAAADESIGAANLLCVLTDGGTGGGLNFELPQGAVLSKETGQVWQGTPLMAGQCTFWRFVLGSDDDAASATAVRVQGTSGTVNADLVMEPLLDPSVPFILNYFSLAMPPSP